MWQAVAMLGMPLIGTLWYDLLALLVSSHFTRAAILLAERWLGRVTGTVMVAFGHKLLVQR